MPRIDDYKQALLLAKDALKTVGGGKAAQMGGGVMERDGGGREIVRLRFLGKEIRILWSEMSLSRDPDQEMPLQEQILVLHYLKGCYEKGGPLSGEWIAFQDIPDGKFYLDAFLRRAKIPLLQSFGHQPERLTELAAKAYGARPFVHGDVSVLVQALPMVPVALVLWKGDEEFPPEANLIFDRSVRDLLSAEDVAWLSGMIVYPLIGMARKK
jgi:hypothetical protein